MPEMDPPVPILATRWVMRPAVCCQISGPVLRKWASGLWGLEYWSGWYAPAVVSTNRRATE